jgi:hypothetical protein
VKQLLCGISLFVFVSFCPGAQDNDIDFDYIEGKKLSVNLNTRILGGENETVIIADITPYFNPDNTIFLVAKGEIFLSDSDDSEEVKYYTTLKSLPVDVGEKVIFFPLGMAYDSKSNFYVIEMEIQVLSVEDKD